MEEVLHLKRDDDGALEFDPVLEIVLSIRGWATKPITLAQINEAVGLILADQHYVRREVNKIVAAGFELASGGKKTFKDTSFKEGLPRELRMQMEEEFHKFYGSNLDCYTNKNQEQIHAIKELMSNDSEIIWEGSLLAKKPFTRNTIIQWANRFPDRDAAQEFIAKMNAAYDRITGDNGKPKPFITLSDGLAK